MKLERISLTWFFCGLVFGAALLLLVAIQPLQQSLERSRLDEIAQEDLSQMVTRISLVINQALIAREFERAQSLFFALTSAGTVLEAALLDDVGRVVLASRSEWLGKPVGMLDWLVPDPLSLGASSVQQVDGAYAFAARRSVQIGTQSDSLRATRSGHLYVVMDFSGHLQRSHFLMQQFGIAAVLVFMVCALAQALLLHRMVVRPLRLFKSRLGEDVSNKSWRSLPARGLLEVSQLARRCNDMASTIAHDHEALFRQGRELESLAHTDQLTGLPNRNQMMTWLEQYEADYSRLVGAGILFIDLDGFKEVNDTFGHAIGDTLLRQVACRIRESLDDDQVLLARFGGDEFVAVVPPSERSGDSAGARIYPVARNVLTEMERPFVLHHQQFRIGASIGIFEFPDFSVPASEAVRNADTAMFEAKAAGGGCYRLYSQSLTDRAIRRHAVKAAIGRCLEADGFELHFQPQVDMRTSRIVGAEALVRMHDRELGEVGPFEFIPIAEQTGEIHEIGQRVLAMACKQWEDWRDAGLELNKLAVNVSGVQLTADDVVSRLDEVVRASGCPRSVIQIELTETALLTERTPTMQIIEEFRGLGYGIAIDDFGTGYSCLSYLTSLPISTLKIDRAFVNGLPGKSSQSAVAGAIIAMAHELDFDLVAEGVETLEQVEFLVASDCVVGQGYHYAKPLPAAEFLDFARANKLAIVRDGTSG